MDFGASLKEYNIVSDTFPSGIKPLLKGEQICNPISLCNTSISTEGI